MVSAFEDARILPDGLFVTEARHFGERRIHILDRTVHISDDNRIGHMIDGRHQALVFLGQDLAVGGVAANDDFGRFSGTSMAAPYVAGASILLRQAYELLGGLETEDISETILEDIFSRFCIGK